MQIFSMEIYGEIFFKIESHYFPNCGSEILTILSQFSAFCGQPTAETFVREICSRLKPHKRQVLFGSATVYFVWIFFRALFSFRCKFESRVKGLSFMKKLFKKRQLTDV